MNILKFYVLHFSILEDLWPYSNAYVRPGTRANPEKIIFRYSKTKQTQKKEKMKKKQAENILSSAKKDNRMKHLIVKFSLT